MICVCVCVFVRGYKFRDFPKEKVINHIIYVLFIGDFFNSNSNLINLISVEF